MDFYVTLPSNGSMDKYENNTQSSFTNYFPHPIELNDQYQVGLAEISYTQDVICDIGNIFIDSLEDIKSHGLVILDDCADRISFENLIYQINDILKQAFQKYYDEAISKNLNYFKGQTIDQIKDLLMANFEYNKLENKYRIKMPKHLILTFNGIVGEILKIPIQANELPENNDLKYQLGPKTKDWIFEGNYLIDPILHIKDNYYVYTDIIKNQYYGSELAKVIRNVVPLGLRGEQVSLTYETIHYVNLQYTDLKSISIYIRDSQERLIKFNNKLSKVVVKLHFKKI